MSNLIVEPIIETITPSISVLTTGNTTVKTVKPLVDLEYEELKWKGLIKYKGLVRIRTQIILKYFLKLSLIRVCVPKRQMRK